MPGSIRWTTETPQIVETGDHFQINLRSDTDVFKFRISPHDFQAFVTEAFKHLRRFDRHTRGRVVDIRGPG